MRSLPMILLLIGALACTSTSALAAGQVWPVTGGGGMRLGYTPLHLPVNYDVDWTVDLQGSAIGDSSPVVDEHHRIYVATNDDAPRVLQSYLYCIGGDGTLIWKVPIGARLDFQPVLLANGTILVITTDKQLFAFNSAGNNLWTQQLNAAPSALNGNFHNNYSVNSRVPAHIQPVPDSSGGFYVIDDSPAIISFDGAGVRRWNAAFLNTPTGGLTMGNGTIYYTTSDGWLHVHSAVTGADFGPIALNGTAPFYGTYMPGSFLYYPVLATNGPHTLAYSIAQIRPFDYQMSLSPTAPVSVDAAGEALVSIGAAGSPDKSVMTDGQVIGLDKQGRTIWSRDFSAIPSGCILADSAGLICFGTQGIGQMGVYCFSPQRGVIWWTLTTGATTVFPVDDYLLGEIMFHTSQENRTTLTLIGGKH